jgi:hypothetical protein
MATSPDVIERVMTLARLDRHPPHRTPAPWRVGVALLASIGLSLLADAALVAIGTGVFPSTKGYVHFAFHDYARLTIVGITIAAAAWPVVVRVSSAPRWLFVRLAIVVTAVLLLPDLFIAAQGQPLKAVVVLMAMHLAIAVITYTLLVRVAPQRERVPVP